MPRMLIVTTVSVMMRAFFLPFARHFRALGWRVDGLCRGISDCGDCRGAFDQVHEAPWSRNPADWRNLLAAPGVVRDLVRENDYDLVHVHSPIAGFVTRYALRNARRAGKPAVVYTAHGFHFFRGGPLVRGAIYRACEKLAGRWTDALLVVNEEDRQAALRGRFVPEGNLHLFPGLGVDLARFQASRVSDQAVAAVRREVGLRPGDALITMIAEFIPRKRHADALRALAQLRRGDIVLALAGMGRDQVVMRRLAEHLDIARQVRFLGFRQDIPALVRASTATLLPSRQEGLANAVIESLSLGVPVIGANTRGIRELLTDGRGLRVEVGDRDGLARAIAWMADHPAEAAVMGQRGAAAMGPYDLRLVLGQTEALYSGLLANRAAGSTRRVA